MQQAQSDIVGFSVVIRYKLVARAAGPVGVSEGW